MGKRGMFCQKTKELHQVTATGIQNKKERRVQSTRYNFPEGYSLMNFVDGRKGVKIKNRFRMQPINLGFTDEDNNDVFWHGVYIFWVFKVDKEVRLLTNSDDSDDDYAVMTKRMYRASMEE